MAGSTTTEILPAHEAGLRAAAVARAAALLRAGQVVALPTETVYGLAANALEPAAVQRIFTAKGRPAHNPLIAHVASRAMARRCVADWPPLAEALARAFWPGPLTLVLPRSEVIPRIVTAGGPTVAIRWPAHPIIRAVIEECGFPLAAPSANPSNRISPTTAEHVFAGLAGRIPLIVDGGPCAVGIESTVVDVTSPRPRILRPGGITSAQIRKVWAAGEPEEGPAPETAVPRSPGQLPRHYAPRATVVVRRWADVSELAAFVRAQGWPPNRVCVLAYEQIPAADQGYLRVAVVPADPVAYARALYAELHQCDASGARAVIVETPPTDPAWEAVHDRLKRAARAPA